MPLLDRAHGESEAPCFSGHHKAEPCPDAPLFVASWRAGSELIQKAQELTKDEKHVMTAYSSSKWYPSPGSSSELPLWRHHATAKQSDPGAASQLALPRDDLQKVPYFPLSPRTVGQDAAGCSKMWLRNPANIMALKHVREQFDEDQNGTISRGEFRRLLAATGSKASPEQL